MPRLLVIVLALLPSAALAHDGPHAHPHGTEWFAVAAVLVLLGAGALAWRRRG